MLLRELLGSRCHGETITDIKTKTYTKIKTKTETDTKTKKDKDKNKDKGAIIDEIR